MSTIEREDRLIRYLLGEVSPQEREQVEARYIEDEDFFTELQVAEDEIIDAYVNDHLSARDRELFERHFINSQRRREKVRSARALMAFARKHKGPATQVRVPLWERARNFLRLDYPVLQWALVAGMVVAVVAGGWLWREFARLRLQLTDAQAEQRAQHEREQEMNRRLQERVDELNKELAARSQQNEKLKQENAQSRQEIARLGVIYEEIEVPVDRVRGSNTENTKIISLPRKAETVRLKLNLKHDEYARYRVAFINAQGREIWQGSFPGIRTASGQSVIAGIPAGVLGKGDYRLTLTGVTKQNENEVISEFPVRIVRK